MTRSYLDIATTPAVAAAQDRLGSRELNADVASRRVFTRFGEDEAAFIAARDSFYLATVSETGWPYVQHRGGPPGFLKVLDEKTLGVADFSGNRQYITLGNLAASDKASLFLMDYLRQGRMKLFVRARRQSRRRSRSRRQTRDARLSRPGRARLAVRPGGARLELPPAYRQTADVARGGERHRRNAAADRHAGGGERGATSRRAPGIVSPFPGSDIFV